MTKQQEIARLDSLIKTLGSDSYLGPWLESVKRNVEMMIRGDVFPDIVPSETAENLRKQVEQTKKDCEFKIQRAESEAAGIIRNAKDRANEIISYAKRRLNEALDKLN